MALPWKTAWITGGSTGIGRELAVQLARQGVRVAVTARGADKLEALAREVPGIVVAPADVTRQDEVDRAFAIVRAELGEIDLAVLNAGVWDPMGASDFSSARVAATMAVNHTGVATGLECLIPVMTARRAGQIALVSSVAGYRGLPKAAAYAPSKAAVISLAEVLKPDLERHGVVISVVNPGFVETPMTAVNRFPMPYILSVEDATRRMVRGLAKGRFEVAFPWQMVATLKVLRVLPYSVYFWLIRNVVAPAGEDAPSEKKGL